MDVPLQSSVKTEIPSPSGSEKHPCRSDSSTRSPYMCRKCRVHGHNKPVKQHKRSCPFRECPCNACKLVNDGRTIVAKQIALYRDQKANSGSNSEYSSTHAVTSQTGPGVGMPPSSNGAMGFTFSLPMVDEGLITSREGGPHCRKCRNHRKINAWKGHKKICQYKNCPCPQCLLITQRKITEKSLREIEAHSLQGHVDKNHVSESQHIPKMMAPGHYSLNPLPMPAPQPPNYSYSASISVGQPHAWPTNGMYSSPPGCCDTKLPPQPGGNSYNHSYNSMVITPNHFSTPAGMFSADYWSSFHQ